MCCTDSDVSELQMRLAAAEQESKRLADALSVEKMTKLELSEKTDDLNSQLSQQKELLLESQRRSRLLQFKAVLFVYEL